MSLIHRIKARLFGPPPEEDPRIKALQDRLDALDWDIVLAVLEELRQTTIEKEDTHHDQSRGGSC